VITPSPLTVVAPAASVPVVVRFSSTNEIAPEADTMLPEVIVMSEANTPEVVPVITVPLIAAAVKGAAAKFAKSPVDAAVAVVVPTVKPVALSSHIRIALSPVEPRSIIIPESFALLLAPLFSSSRLSVTTVLVVLTVVVVPLMGNSGGRY
jgi:hypothetical protein